MKAFQIHGYLAVLFTELLLIGVMGDGTKEEKLDIKYVLIGGGIGLFIVAVLIIIIMFCISRKQTLPQRGFQSLT
ncbi:uncharacterized protein KZ484_002229 isoform 2-T2 [Pholidichthys leucotaenia]